MKLIFKILLQFGNDLKTKNMPMGGMDTLPLRTTWAARGVFILFTPHFISAVFMAALLLAVKDRKPFAI